LYENTLQIGIVFTQLYIMTIQQNIKIATDAVVFGYDNTGIYLLLIERKHPSRGIHWALPGGFVENNESAKQAVFRELKEETHLSLKTMKQFHTFSEVNRDPRMRVISIAYFALTNRKGIHLQAADDAKTAQWVLLNEIPTLAFDHNEIVSLAIENLKKSVASFDLECFNETPNLEEIKLIGNLLKKGKESKKDKS